MSPIEPPAAQRALMRAISPDRLTTYQHAAAQAGQDVLDLYLWDRDTAAAALADIAILEVAMRNAMHTALAGIAGRPDWYAVDIGLDDRSLKAITAAWSRLPDVQRTPGRVVAQLMFGFWRDLLERGGSRGAGPLRTQANYDDLWRQGLYRAFPGGRLEARAAGEQWTRTWTLDVVKEVHALRNRAAHHEPLVNGLPMPGENRRIGIDRGHESCQRLAAILDRDLAAWLATNSQLQARLGNRPTAGHAAPAAGP